MTADDLERDPHFARFLDNFARHCGAPRSVFVGQLAAAVSPLTDERDRLRALAERNYPGLEPSGICSRGHDGRTDYLCRICFPSWRALVTEHAKVNRELAAERDRLRAALDMQP
jgi:hypothetical protein